MYSRSAIDRGFLLAGALLAFALCGYGSVGPLEIRASSTQLETEPGRIVTASFRVLNHAATNHELVEEIGMPESWHKVAPSNGSFPIAGGSQEIRVVAIFVPAGARAGNNAITYSVRSRIEPGLLGSSNLSVTVRAFCKLEIVTEDKVDALIAGDPLEVRYNLLNRGNGDLRVELQAKSSLGQSVELSPKKLVLAAGSSERVRLRLVTDTLLRRRATLVVSLNAIPEQGGAALASLSMSIDLLPRITNELDAFHRLPAGVRFIGVKQNGNSPALQAEFFGSGDLDEGKQRKFEFLLRGPDLRNDSIFGVRDEYRVSYIAPRLELHAGDRNYSLSPLSERYGYGRGFELGVHRDSHGFGLFYFRSRWKQYNVQEVGAFVERDVTSNFRLRGNLLLKQGGYSVSDSDQGASIQTIEVQVKLGDALQVNAEAGFSRITGGGATDHGYRAEARGVMKSVRYAVERSHAGPQFAGSYRDMDVTSATIDFPVYRRMSASFSAYSYSSNLNLDVERGISAPREITYRPALRFKLRTGSELAVEYLNVIRRNMLGTGEGDFRERSVKFGLAQRFGGLQLHSSIEHGTLEKLRTRSKGSTVDRYSVYATYAGDTRASVTVFARLGSTSFTADPENERNLGGSATWRIRESLVAALHYNRSEYSSIVRRDRYGALSIDSLDPEYARYRFNAVPGRKLETAQVSLSYTLHSRSVLSLVARWWRTSFQAQNESSVFFTYTVPIGIPLSRKPSLARLEGSLFEIGPSGKKPLERVVVVLNDATTVTNKNGVFLFPALQPGIYLLRLDQRYIGAGRVTTQPLPLMVEIKQGETIRLEMGVVSSASISVRMAAFRPGDRSGASARASRLVISPDAPNDDQSHLEEAEGIPGGVVQITNGSEVLSQTADRNGRVTFGQLRPGIWKVRIYVTEIPEHHYVENTEREFEIKAGERGEVLVRVLPKLRRIQVIDEGVITSSGVN